MNRKPLFALIPLLLAPAAHAQIGGTYDLTWSVLARGGGTSAGGTYSLSGTVGQPGTDSAGVSGGQFSLIGGFWHGASPPCRADFNGNGHVTVQDIFDFLAAWFANSPRADFNHSGTVSVQDIFDFLAAWFAGCP
jgi:hypothetical protein